MVQGAVQLDVVIDGKSLTIGRKNLSSLQVTRNLGDAANKFTLEVFDESAYQIENALAGKGQPSITVRYSAANNWEHNGYASVLFTGVCIDYQVSFVGRATMLSLEGILSASRTNESSVDWWFKKSNINWCNADLEYNEETGMNEIDGHSADDAIGKSIGDIRFDVNDPQDIVCAYTNDTGVTWTDPMTGDIIESNTTDVYVNPARIFRRIMAAYNKAYPGCFPVAEIEECRWVKGLDTIQHDETAAEYITRVLCKNAVTYTNNGSNKLKDQVAGFQYFVDANGHHFKRLNYMDSNTTNTISLHFGTKDSRVISFTAANVGALAMAGFHNLTDEQLATSLTGLDKLYSESITIGGENLTGSGGEQVDVQSNYFVDMIKSGSLDITEISSSSTSDVLSTSYTTEYTDLENLPFEAQLTIWGEYSNEIKPGNFINLLTYDTSGNKHYTTGIYYITEVVDDVSSEGFIQTVTMIKNLSAYKTGSIDADDTTGLNKSEDYSHSWMVGNNNYTMAQIGSTTDVITGSHDITDKGNKLSILQKESDFTNRGR